MANTVIGYKKHFSYELINFHKINVDDILNAKFEKKFARVISDKDIIEENPNDILDQLITNNIGTCVAYDKENNIATVMFQHEIPLDIYKKYYDNEPIFKTKL